MNTSPNEADIRALLRADHEHTLRLVRDLCEAGSADERRALLERLRPALLAHSRAEEHTVYDRLIDPGATDDAPKTGAEGRVDHDLVETLLAELAQTRRADGAEWIAAATVMKELLEAHIDGEQDVMFAALGQRFSADELRSMGSRFLAAKEQWLAGRAARPHPLLRPPVVPHVVRAWMPGGE